MLDWFLDTLQGKLFGSFIVLSIIFAVFYFSYQEQVAWDKFSDEHHCVVIATTDSTVATTLLTDGKMGTTVIPGKNTYHCDDGVNYTRTK